MTEKKQLTFSENYAKLKDEIFATVRWLDAKYELGKVYEIILVEKRKGFGYHRKSLGYARVTALQIYKLDKLATEEFCRYDAGRSREEYFKLMTGWYSRKLDWRGWDSEVQVLTCKRVKQILEPPQKTLEA